MEEGAARALKDDEIAQRMELLIGNQTWQKYITQNKHHGLPVGTLCQVRFRVHISGRLLIAVRFWISILKRRQKLRFPMASYWYFPGLEDVELARHERDKPELRHTSASMRPY